MNMKGYLVELIGILLVLNWDWFLALDLFMLHYCYRSDGGYGIGNLHSKFFAQFFLKCILNM